jgi:hypothetical protein
VGNRSYDSKFEGSYGQELELRLKADEIKAYETHVRMPLMVNGYHIGDYYIDFAVYHNDETVEYVETKGYATDVWKLKWKIFCATHEDDPNVKITLVMQGKKTWKPRIKKI